MNTYQNLKFSPWRKQLFEVIFEADTQAGKLFDIILIISILLSVTVVMLDSVSSISDSYGRYLYAAEWLFTGLFTVEYILRIICFGYPIRYMLSFFGIVDLLAIVPTYLSIFIPGSHALSVIRILRVLRIFRVFKLSRCLSQADLLKQALFVSRRKILVFLTVVLTLVVVIGSIMYIIEGEDNGFTSIPKSVYWAVVTLTTVGYGDISPSTGMGQFLASIVMILGYSIIAVPTGIVTAELAISYKQKVTTQVCPECCKLGHDSDAEYCKFCGKKL